MKITASEVSLYLTIHHNIEDSKHKV